MKEKTKEEQDSGELEPLGTISSEEKETKSSTTTRKESQLESLLRQNLEINHEILEMVQYVKKYVFWQKIFGVLKVLLILGPIIIGIIYLPPFLDGMYGNFKTFVEESGLGLQLPEDLSMGSIAGVLTGGTEIKKEHIETFNNMSEEERARMIEEYNSMSESEKQRALKELNK